MKLVNKYLNNNNVSFDVRCRIKNYLKYYCDKDIETNEDQVLIYIYYQDVRGYRIAARKLKGGVVFANKRKSCKIMLSIYKVFR